MEHMSDEELLLAYGENESWKGNDDKEFIVELFRRLLSRRERPSAFLAHYERK